MHALSVQLYFFGCREKLTIITVNGGMPVDRTSIQEVSIIGWDGGWEYGHPSGPRSGWTGVGLVCAQARRAAQRAARRAAGDSGMGGSFEV